MLKMQLWLTEILCKYPVIMFQLLQAATFVPVYVEIIIHFD